MNWQALLLYCFWFALGITVGYLSNRRKIDAPREEVAELRRIHAQPAPIGAEKRRQVFRARRSDWDTFAAEWERQHGPNKDLNPVEQAGVEALRRAKEQHQ